MSLSWKKMKVVQGEECWVNHGLCLPRQLPFKPQIPCLSHVPAIISTLQTPESLHCLHFKVPPSSPLKLKWHTNRPGHVLWDLMVWLCIIQVSIFFLLPFLFNFRKKKCNLDYVNPDRLSPDGIREGNPHTHFVSNKPTTQQWSVLLS